jgi:isopenicillin N synthase-like dioxygenase
MESSARVGDVTDNRLGRAHKDARELVSLLEQAQADGLKVRKWEMEVAKRGWPQQGRLAGKLLVGDVPNQLAR